MELEEFKNKGYFLRRSLVKNVSEILGSMQEQRLQEPPEVRFNHVPSFLLETYASICDWIVSILGEEFEFVETHFANLPSGYRSSGKWHMDGKGLVMTRDGSIHDLPEFQLLVGLYLSDMSLPQRGQLRVAPSGHLTMQEFFRRAAGELAALDASRASGVELFKRLESENHFFLQSLNACPGDVVFAHSMLPHAISSNTGPIRHAIYFRVGRYKTTGLAALTDIWRGFVCS